MTERLFTRHEDTGRRTAFPLVTWSADGKRLAAYVNKLHV